MMMTECKKRMNCGYYAASSLLRAGAYTPEADGVVDLLAKRDDVSDGERDGDKVGEGVSVPVGGGLRGDTVGPGHVGRGWG